MILVVGGTGDLGSRIVKKLVDGDHQVRCLVRSGSGTTELADLGAELVVGDLRDPDSLRPACVGVTTVVASATAIGRRLAGEKSTSIGEVDGRGMAALVDAAEAAGVERFVYVSYAGVELGLGMPLEQAKLATERRLARSPMRSVLVRPDAFQEIHLGPVGRFDLAAGKVAIFGKGDVPNRWVATEDVASLVAAVTVEPEPPAIVEFGGPEALSRNDAVALAEQETGRSFKVQRAPLLVAKLGMRLLGGRNDAMASIFGTGVMQAAGGATWDDEPLRARGIEPRSASDWIRRQAATVHPTG